MFEAPPAPLPSQYAGGGLQQEHLLALRSIVDQRARAAEPMSWGASGVGRQYEAGTLGHVVSQQHLLDQMAAYGLPPSQEPSYGAPLQRCVSCQRGMMLSTNECCRPTNAVAQLFINSVGSAHIPRAMPQFAQPGQESWRRASYAGPLEPPLAYEAGGWRGPPRGMIYVTTKWLRRVALQHSTTMHHQQQRTEYGGAMPKAEPGPPLMDSLAMLLPAAPSAPMPPPPPPAEQFQLSSDALLQVSKLLKEAGYDALP